MSPLRFLAVTMLAVFAVTTLAAAGGLAYGRDALWTDLFGQPDVGAYDFDLPKRTGKPNDSLACPEPSVACANVPVDHWTPVFEAAGPVVFDVARRLIEAMPGAVVVEDQGERLQLRAVVRTPLLRFPDTLSIRVREPAPGQAEVWLYSRSQIGHFDFGANDRRIRDLLRQLQRTFTAAGTG
jgi:uncharacterized protein (DUF1499 family)